MSQAHLFIIAAASGAGKTTLVKALLNKDDLFTVMGKVKTAYFTMTAINEVAGYNNGRLRLMD